MAYNKISFKYFDIISNGMTYNEIYFYCNEGKRNSGECNTRFISLINVTDNILIVEKCTSVIECG